MKIVILSRSAQSYSTRRLREACANRGHTVRVLDTLRFAISVRKKKPRLYYRDKLLSHYDAVIPRIGASITFYGTAVVRQFEQMGVFTLASSNAIAVSRDKLRALQVLSRERIGIPDTVFVRDRAAVAGAIERLGGTPIVVKLIEGTQGMGVILAETGSVALAVIETLHDARQNVLVQRFVRESRGKDIRAFVVGGRVVAAMRRTAQGDEFRSNVHLGGRTARVDLDPEYERTAILAARVLGLRVAGVDMLESNDGPQVIEVNSSPGLEGIEAATGVDVADAIASYVEDASVLPEVDVKQRLGLDHGYAVTEFVVAEPSALAGATVSGASQSGLTVLRVQRGDAVLSNPAGAERIEAGDRVLVYGAEDALKRAVRVGA
ncbi:MAG: RimK family alpha-L-glutamate ligase [Sandaracinaceae bacterium]